MNTPSDEPDRSPKPQPEADDQPPPAPRPAMPSATPSAEITASITLEVFDTHNLLDQPTHTLLSETAARVLALLPNAGDIRVSIVDDARMSIAHEQFSGITGTTDVLTFDLAPETNAYNTKVLDTDLTICVDEAKRQAIIHNHQLAHELLLYIIHGTLHCLGYNDHDDTQYQRMHQREDQLLTQAGIGPLFFPNNKSSQSSIPKETKS